MLYKSCALKYMKVGATGSPDKGSQKPWDLTTTSKPRLAGACFTRHTLLAVPAEMQLCVRFVGRALPTDRVILTLNLG